MQYKNVYVQLARLGDQLTLLPLLWRDAQEGHRSAIMVHEQYAPHLENSYYDTLIWSGETHDIGGALEGANRFGNAVSTQVLGPPDTVRKYTYEPQGLQNAICTSFQKESWRAAGRLKEWDECYPLVFDQRSPEREAEILAPFANRKKIILVSADGISSPFPYKPLLLELLKVLHCHIVDLSTIKTERFFDLLGLYERAYCLVAIDSAPLHLAQAVPRLPVVALANDKPLLWNGASWRPQHIFYCRYNDFPYRAAQMIGAIRGIDSKPRRGDAIVHVWQDYESKGCDSPPGWIQTPVEIGACGRDSGSQLKDEKRFPFLRDSLRMGLQRARDNDWVCLTRPQTFFAPNATEILTKQEACFAYRISGNNGERSYAPIGDCFFARKTWWKKVLPEMPDLLLASDYHWSHVLVALFKLHGALDVTGICYRK